MLQWQNHNIKFIMQVILVNIENSSYQPGDIVYVFYRNPHTQTVTNIQEAAVVQNPDKPGELALFLYETYYPLTEEIAVYSTQVEAESAYNHYYGGYGIEETFR